MTGSATPRNYRQTILLLLVLSRIIKEDIVVLVLWHVHSRSALYWLHADKSPLPVPADAVRLAGTIVGELFGFVLSSHLSLHKTV